MIPSHEPAIAKITIGDKEVKVIKIMKLLGRGSYGNVKEAILEFPDGHQVDVALKLLYKNSNPIIKSEKIESQLMNAINDPKAEHSLHYESIPYSYTNLETPNNVQGMKQEVVLSPLEDGSLDKNIGYLDITKIDINYNEKLKILDKFINQGMKGIRALAESGLSHTDVKPANFLVSTTKDFNWNNPLVDKINFKLADFDGVMPPGEIISEYNRSTNLPHTWVFRAPEVYSAEGARTGAAYDIYSLAVSAYQAVYGKYPWQDFVGQSKLLQGFPFLKSRDKTIWTKGAVEAIYGDPEIYEEYSEWLKKQISHLDNKQLTNESRNALMRIESFFNLGFSFDPRKRETLLHQYFKFKNSMNIPKTVTQDICSGFFKKIKFLFH
jgi:serine/threonine protein kinase